MEPRVQKEILSDLRESDRLRDTLDVVDIVINFLSSGGGKPEKLLGDYTDRVLKMKGRLSSQKVKKRLASCFYVAMVTGIFMPDRHNYAHLIKIQHVIVSEQI